MLKNSINPFFWYGFRKFKFMRKKYDMESLLTTGLLQTNTNK